jgi:hypothetical protein
MNENTQQLLALIKNKSKELNINSQILLQNYMIERFLIRISKSDYKNNFILKGGFLIASLIGVDLRTTMDMDGSFVGIDFSQQKIIKFFNEVARIKIDDNVTFDLINIKPIKEGDDYGGTETPDQVRHDG